MRHILRKIGYLMMTLQSCFLLGADKPTNTHMPPRAVFFYGYPSLVNGAEGNVQIAAKAFSSYDIIVFGDGVEFPTMVKKRRPIGVGRVEYERSKEIVATILRQKPQTEIFGYVCLGNTQALSMNSIKHRILMWKELGVSGVFLDEAGYDWPIMTRSRQNAAIRLAHSLGMTAFLNAYQPETLISGVANSTKNPSSESSALTSHDLILLESFPIKQGIYVDPSELHLRLEQALNVRKQFSSRIVALSTTQFGSSFREDQMEYACWCAWMFDMNGIAWGEPDFSSDNQLPERKCGFMELSPEQLRASPSVHVSDYIFARKAYGGLVVLDIANKTISLRHGQYELDKAHTVREMGRSDAISR